jgi:tRNA modification GTPase
MNALAGFNRSIVDPSAGTTRDAVTLDTAFEGWPVRLVDTAGIRETVDAIESVGVERAREAARSADLVLIVIDGSEPLAAEDHVWLESWPDAIRVWNKNDLGGSEGAKAQDVRVSATTGAGLEQLIERMMARLIPVLPPGGQAVPVCREQVEWLTHFPADAIGGLGERDQ